ncbi:Histidinol-phosphatase [hydrothermal vent metagenome]|uniref:D,D-heptose 1,7-bisphosphate phosphatase n=1 Tax=hydrothermal vent metagenome TaxID=652676 RepID=A0A3B0ZC46_9ZZZZ
MKLIILDRDGVINQDSDEFIKSADEFIPIPGSLEAISRLNHAGFSVMVATNQSGISRGLFSVETLNSMHDKLRRLLSAFGGHIDGIFYCPHSADDHCECRKPNTGLYLDIAQRSKCNLNDVYAVGDSLRDLQAAEAAGAKPILVKTGKGLRTLEHKDTIKHVPVFDNLSHFVDNLLAD